MGIADDMKMVAGDIVSSYQSRISTVATIIENTHQILEDFKTRRNEMSEQLKENLANGGSLRKKDFDSMMKDILRRQDEREKEMRDLLKTFFEEQKEIAQNLKKNLAEGAKVQIDEFKKSLKDIQARQKVRENEVTMKLKKFQKEHNEMDKYLRGLLSKGEAIRIKDLKEMVKDIQLRQKERGNKVKARQAEFREEKQSTDSPWNELAVAMAQKRAAI